jgi:very-short-patch-repair endonuclease
MFDEPATESSHATKKTVRPLDLVMSGMADRQHGVVARRQLLEIGMGHGSIVGRLARGSLHPVHRGVYAVGRSGLDMKGRWMAAVLSGGPNAVLSHRSAGLLWGLIGIATGPVEITRPRGSRTRRPGILGHEATLVADETARTEGIPVTSPFRTLFDLAAGISSRQLERAMNEADVRRLTDRISLRQLLDRHPGHRGTANLRALLNADTPGGITCNDFEEAFVALLDETGLPRPRFNADLAVRGRFFEVDCLWDEKQLIAELDGRAAHGTHRAFETDRERDRILLVEGWRSTRITWRQLQDEPEAVASDLRMLLSS